MAVERVLLAEPRGFCAGVEKAIKALAWMVCVFEPPVYCYHEIVHNQHVVDQFRAQGVIFVDDVDDVPEGSPIMLSAHGTAPDVVRQARQRGGVVIDAVCPLVTKVHHELKVRSRKGYTILYIGHSGHEEAVGTMAVAPEAVHLVERESDLDALDTLARSSAPVALLAQTTLSHDEWRGLKEAAERRFPEPVDAQPGRSVLRHHQPTSGTQGHRGSLGRGDRGGLGQFLQHGGARDGGARLGVSRVVRVDSASEVPGDLAGTVGITAGASAPELLVAEIVSLLAPSQGVETVHVTEEDEYFPPPPELRELLRALSTAVGLLCGNPVGDSSPDPVGEDRELSAADVLGAFAS